MPHQDTTVDIKALARGIRASGIAVAKQANQLQLAGKTLEAEAISEAVQELIGMAEKLEAWRLHQAQALRQAADMTEGVALTLEGIAQQLEPREERES